MSKKSIVVVSPYRTEYGPPQTLEHVCRSLVDMGYHPIAVVPPGARITASLAALQISIRTVETLTTVPRTYNPLRLARFVLSHLKTAKLLGRILQEEQAVAVFSISEATFAGSLAAARVGIPSIVHVIGMSIQSPRIAADAYVRFLASRTDRFIACSAAVADMLVSLGAPSEKVSVVHNGIPVATVVAAAATLPSPVSHAGPRIGMLAAYDRRKGHELFIAAAQQIVARHPDACFYMIGGSLNGQPESRAFEEYLDETIRRLGLIDQIQRVGYVRQPDVYAWVRAMDVIVVPSRTEAFAHALLEGMACGRPVVATAIEGNLDAFVEGHSGHYVESTAEAVSEGVCGFLDDPAYAARVGAAARERVERFFDLHVTLPALGQTVDQLVRAHARPTAGRS